MTSFLKLRFQIKCLFIICSLTFIFKNNAVALSWPSDLTNFQQEFQKKIAIQDIAPSTRYFARGPTFLMGKKWNEALFISQLQKQNYRIRTSQQILMAGDAKKLNYEECKLITTSQQLGSNETTCWNWKTHQNENNLVYINNNIVEATFTGDTSYKINWKTSLDPILIAQYRGPHPLMQNELKISEFPVNCLNAVMAIEDSDFLNHSGISYIGLGRSVVKNISKMRYAQGGSTITQQLVKNYFLTPEKTLTRKLKELYLAVKLESEWTKDQILETYLNIIYMGQSGAFQVAGFGAASEYYFNTPIQKLDLPDCALIAAIINSPGLYNPWKNPEQSLTRRNLVLKKMQDYKLINAVEYSAALTKKLPVHKIISANETAPYFFEAAKKQITQLNLTEQSQNIYTSLDLDLQRIAQLALQKKIIELEKSKKNLIKNKAQGFKLEGLVISTENQSALVTAMVGGQNYKQTQYNRALNSQRQIGSLIKPFVYLSALIHGIDQTLVTPTTIINDTKFIWAYDNKKWSPANYDKKFNGEVPLYFALKESLNAPTAQVAQKVGLEKIINLAHELGFTSTMAATPATSLGASTHFPIELIDSYRTLANLGQFSKSSFIEKITDKEKNIIFEYTPKFEKKINADDAAVLVGMLSETLKSGTAKSAQALGWNQISAGKTGTTSNNKDAWFAGFTPYQTTLVWLGYDQTLSSQLTGASGAVPIWVDIMTQQSLNWQNNDFKYPDNIEKRNVQLHLTENQTVLIFKK